MITNDPWMGTGHIHDVSIAMPIFHKGKLVAFAAVVSHMPDIGGRLRNAGVREIFEEGLQIPRLKLIEGGKPNQTLFDMIAQNVRVPEMTLGDIWAQVAACKMMEERLQPLLRDTDLDALGAEIRGRSEAAMRKAIRAVPDGAYHSRLEHDGFEEPIVINCTVHVKGDTIDIDYTGSSDQVPRAVNVVPIYCFAYSAYAVKALLCPDVPNNEGSFLHDQDVGAARLDLQSALSRGERRARHDRPHDGAGDHHGARAGAARARDRGRLVEFVDHGRRRARRAARIRRSAS